MILNSIYLLTESPREFKQEYSRNCATHVKALDEMTYYPFTEMCSVIPSLSVTSEVMENIPDGNVLCIHVAVKQIG